MSVFDLDTEGQRAVEEEAAANPIRADNMGPGFFDHTTKGVGLGLMRGGARVAQAVGLAASAPFAIYEAATGQERKYTDRIYRALDDHINSAVDYWTPNAAEVGKAGQVLGGLSEIVLPLMAGGGNPDLLMATQGLGTGLDLTREGVDGKTAAVAGTLQSLASGIGFKIPFLGKTLLTRMASGAGGNLAVNAGTAAAEQQLLKARGYGPQAEQFNPLNIEARTVDLLTGVAFGALAHTQMRASDRAAIAAANNAKHFQQDTAPGAPADPSAEAVHQASLAAAIHDILSGEPVAVPESVLDANFIARPKTEAVVPPPEYTQRPAPRSIEERFAAQIANDPAAAMDAYAKLPDSHGGKVLNVDTARELSPDYLKYRTRSADVHEPASALIKEIYARKLTEAPKPGERPMVMFTAGGTGAGKSTAIREALGPLAETAQIVYDTNMNGVESSIKKIDQALAAGKDVQIVYTYRDPIEALQNGALTRAMRQEKEFGTGRTVPISSHLETHIGARSAMEKIAAHYAGDSRVGIQVLDNSHGRGNVKTVTLREIPKIDAQAYNPLREQALRTIEAERAAGRISESVFRGFAHEGANPGAVERGVREASGAGTGGQPEPQRPGGNADQLIPDAAAAEQALAESDFQIPTGETDADGNPRTVSARELMAQADADIQQAQIDARAFDAAVTCFLSKGAE